MYEQFMILLIGSAVRDLKKVPILSAVLTMAVVLLLTAPLLSYAAGTTVSVQTNSSSYPGVPGTHVIISGAVSPAPVSAGYSVSLEINTSQGLLTVYSTPVSATSGSFTYTMTTGYAPNGWINGTYTIVAVYASSSSGPTYTGSTTFQYGASATTTTSTGSTSQSTTTITTTVTSTTISISTTTQITVTTVPTTVTSSTTMTTTSTVTNSTWEYIGIAGIAAAIVLAGLTVFMMRRY